jgi:hypothetical protein
MRYRNFLHIALSALTCLFLAIPASAQRPATGGGGGSSSRPASSSGGASSGGGSTSSARPSGSSGSVAVRPSGGGSAGISRGPSNGNIGVSRPQGAYQRNGTMVSRGPVYVDRQGNILSGNVAQRIGTNNPQRGNYGYAPRTGVVTNSTTRVGVIQRGATSGNTGAYRTVPQIGYGHGSGYWGNHGYYHYNHGYYNSYYYPRLGFTCGFLPYGYYPFYYGDFQYYYSDGLFYQYDNSQYTVVEPPIGAQITTLPDKAQSIVINGIQYYELNGVYYLPVTKDDGTVVYEIAGKDGELNTGSAVQDNQPQGPQMSDIVNQLPPDCRKIKVNGAKLYVSPDGVYYQEQVDANGGITYKIVGLPSDEQQN